MNRDALPADFGNSEVVTLLRDILAELRALNARLAAGQLLKFNSSIGAALSDLLSLIHAYGDGATFTSSELVQKAAEDAELEAALQACDALTVAQVGQLFAANKDRDIDGLIIERAKRWWSVRRV